MSHQASVTMLRPLMWMGVAVLGAACGAPADEGVSHIQSEVVGAAAQNPADFPEVVLVAGYDADGKRLFREVGVLAAPTAVLTAGHAVVYPKVKMWRVFSPVKSTDPSATTNDESKLTKLAESATADTFDITTADLNDAFLNGKHDVGLIYLKDADKQTLKTWPTFSPTRPPYSKKNAPSKLTIVGRIDGTNTMTNVLQRSDKPIRVFWEDTKTKADVYPDDIVAIPGYADLGDSGSPIYVDASKHTVVAVVSQSFEARKEVPRADVYAALEKPCAWLKKNIEAHGGTFPACPGAGAGGKGGGGASNGMDGGATFLSYDGGISDPDAGTSFVSYDGGGDDLVMYCDDEPCGSSLALAFDPGAPQLPPAACQSDAGSGEAGDSGGIDASFDAMKP